MRIFTILLSIISIIGLTSCSSKPKNQDEVVEKKIIEPNVEIRARENADKKPLWSSSRIGGGGTTYEFATSNVLWKASLQALDFIPLQSANYSGGIIITDWYSADLNSN